MITVAVFALMGFLAGVSSCIDSGVAARCRPPTSIGTLDELYVIAAAVIGGTSLAGGVGTIHGALIGALVIQSLSRAWCCSASTRLPAHGGRHACWSPRSASTPITAVAARSKG